MNSGTMLSVKHYYYYYYYDSQFNFFNFNVNNLVLTLIISLQKVCRSIHYYCYYCFTNMYMKENT